MYFPKPLGMQNGEVLKDKTKKLPVIKGKKRKAGKVETWMCALIKCVSAHQK